MSFNSFNQSNGCSRGSLHVSQFRDDCSFSVRLRHAEVGVSFGQVTQSHPPNDSLLNVSPGICQKQRITLKNVPVINFLVFGVFLCVPEINSFSSSGVFQM